MIHVLVATQMNLINVANRALTIVIAEVHALIAAALINARRHL
jgi:hypothetical protein